MGCNGSKQQQDVAAGNTVTRLLRRKSAVTEGTSSTSPTATATTTATDVAAIDDDSSKHIDDSPATEKAETETKSSVGDNLEETKQNPSCSDHAIAGSEATGVDVHATEATHVNHAGETAVATRSEDEVSNEKDEENVNVADKDDANFSINEGDGESIGKHSMDSKEAIIFEEVEEGKGILESETHDTKSEELNANGPSTD